MVTILIAEDSEKGLYVLKKLLEGMKYEILTAPDGIKALELARKNPVDLIISDILMPHMNGFLLCREVKKDKLLRHIPFVFYTATFVDEQDERLALGLGASRFIVKPVTNDEFLTLIREVLEEHRSGNLQVQAPIPQHDPLFHSMYDHSISRKLDKTVRKLREEQAALKKSEQRLKEAQEIAHLGHWEIEPDTLRMFWSDELYRILGFRPQEITAAYSVFQNLVHSEDRKAVDDAYHSFLNKRIPYEIRHRIQMEDSSVKHIHQQWQAQYDDDGRLLYFIGTLHDITSNVLAEAEQRKKNMIIKQTQKLKMLGQISAGIIHEINQPLTVIQLTIDSILNNLTADSIDKNSLRGEMDSFQFCLDRINTLLDTYGFFSRDQNSIPFTEFSVNNSIANALRLMEKQIIKSDISINKKLSRNIPSVIGNPNSFEQVIMNLLKNAHDALLERDNTAAKKRITIKTVRKQKSILIEVKDNGPGITPEFSQNLFNPFFTTKSEEMGTGLGLSISHQIIQEMGGEIRVKSKPGKYTRFIICLPIKGEAGT